jgi:hypothetical protein
MEDIKEILGLLDIPKMKECGLYEAIFRENSLVERLCDAIYNEEIQTDEEASQLIYQEKPGPKFYNLKERLRSELTDHLLLLDFKSPLATDRQIAYLDCQRKWSAAPFLLSRGVKKSAISILEHTFKQAQHFDFTDVAMGISGTLRLQYGSVIHNTTKFRNFQEYYQQYEQIWVAENRVEDFYTQIVHKLMLPNNSHKAIGQDALEYWQEVSPLLEEYSSFRLHLCGRLLGVLGHIYSGQYDKAIELCDEALLFFDRKSFASDLPKQAFCYQQIACCIRIKDFQTGFDRITRYHNLLEPGTYNWVRYQEMAFLLATHTRHYNQAVKTVTETLPYLKSNKLPSPVLENWHIYQAYSIFLVRAEKAQSFQEAENNFRIKKFQNNITHHSKDKIGMNISVMVVSILFNLLEQDYTLTYENIESMRKYCSRYLVKDSTYRSNCFIRALLQIPAVAFHRAGAARRAEKYITNLKNHPPEFSTQPTDIEIIPYEDIWEIILEQLTNKRRKINITQQKSTNTP